MASELRLYLRHPLGEGQTDPLDQGQAHYLFAVMRRHVGDVLEVFNGVDGSFGARITQSGKRKGALLPRLNVLPVPNGIAIAITIAVAVAVAVAIAIGLLVAGLSFGLSFGTRRCARRARVEEVPCKGGEETRPL